MKHIGRRARWGAWIVAGTLVLSAVPAPVLLTVIWWLTVARLKVAVTETGALSVTVQVGVDSAHPPLQPTKTELEVGAAVSRTDVPVG